MRSVGAINDLGVAAIKRFISRFRSDLQLTYNSIFFTKDARILINSMPKSGTHFYKAALIGMGLSFCGHYGSRSVFSISLNDDLQKFYTGHTRADVVGGFGLIFNSS